MIPKKSSSLYLQVSEDLNLPKDLIESAIEFYYKEVRDNLTKLKHPRINVEGLGQFTIRPNMVRKSIPRLKQMLEDHDTSTFTAYYTMKTFEEKVKYLEEMEKKLNIADVKKNNFKKLKDEEYIKTNLEQQETDSGGDNQ